MPTSTFLRKHMFGLGLSLLLILFVFWQLNHLGGFSWDWDEGVLAMEARMSGEGYKLYGEIFSMVSPLFIHSLSAAFSLAGEALTAGRAMTVLFATLGLVATALIAKELAGPIAGIAAAVMLAIAPHFWVLARTIMADVPAAAVGGLALWAAIRYWRTGRRSWLAAAGFLLSLGLLLKLSAAMAGPLIVALILARDVQDGGRAAVRRVARSGLSTLIPFAIPLVIAGIISPWRPMLDQVLFTTWGRAGAFSSERRANPERLLYYLLLYNRTIALNRGLTALAVGGMVALGLRSWRGLTFLVAGWAVVLATLLSYTPLWDHLVSPLLFPLVVSASAAIGWVADEPARVRRKLAAHAVHRNPPGVSFARIIGPARQVTVALLIIAGLALYLTDLPVITAEDLARQHAPGSVPTPIMDLLRSNTTPNDYVVTDNPLLAFLSDRRIPPFLVDCSVVRLQTGLLTAQQAISVTRQYQAKTVIFWQDERIVPYLPDYVSWVKENYDLLYEDARGTQMYLAPPTHLAPQLLK